MCIIVYQLTNLRVAFHYMDRDDKAVDSGTDHKQRHK